MNLLFLFAAVSFGVVQCSGGFIIVPPHLSQCGSTVLLAAVDFFSNFEILPVDKVIVNETAGSIGPELAGNCSADVPVYLVVKSEQLAGVLREQVLLSITTITGAIAELTEQLSWSRVTILADVSDAYFLRAAETFYKMANSSMDFTFLQLGDSDSEIEDALNMIERLNLKIVVVSLRPSTALKVLCRAHEKNLAWPDYAWIVHSVEVSNESCGKNSLFFEGVVSLQQKCGMQTCRYSTDLEPLGDTYLNTYSVDLCDDYVNASTTVQVSIFQQLGNSPVLISTYEAGEQLATVNLSLPIPSDKLSQYSSKAATIFAAVFYIGISFCFVVTTLSLVLYFSFYNDPGIKATSVSLSILIFAGCYLLIFYLLVLNFTLLPSYSEQSSKVRNLVCFIRVWMNALGLPIALILSTLLVKLVRVYRIFNCYNKMRKNSCRNLSLAVFVLLITLPNALICLIWSTGDPYTSTVSFSVEGGYLVVAEECVSAYTIQWLIGLLMYLVILSFVLITFAILTRKIRFRNFKDTKKIKVLCFLVVFTCATILFYWYLARVIDANAILVHALLQFGHYAVILECQGFIFAPKLLPVVQKRLKGSNPPSTPVATVTTDITIGSILHM